MTTEELNEALSDEAVYARRELLLDALAYELDLVRQATRELEVILDDKPRVETMADEDVETLEKDLDELADVERCLDNAESEIFQSLTGDQMMRYEKEAS